MQVFLVCVFNLGVFENFINFCEESYKQEPWHYADISYWCSACIDKSRNQGYELTVHGLDEALEKKQHKRPVKCELNIMHSIVSVLQLARKHKDRCLQPPAWINLAFCVKIASVSYFLPPKPVILIIICVQ